MAKGERMKRGQDNETAKGERLKRRPDNEALWPDNEARWPDESCHATGETPTPLQDQENLLQSRTTNLDVSSAG